MHFSLNFKFFIYSDVLPGLDIKEDWNMVYHYAKLAGEQGNIQAMLQAGEILREGKVILE